MACSRQAFNDGLGACCCIQALCCPGTPMNLLQLAQAEHRGITLATCFCCYADYDGEDATECAPSRSAKLLDALGAAPPSHWWRAHMELTMQQLYHTRDLASSSAECLQVRRTYAWHRWKVACSGTGWLLVPLCAHIDPAGHLSHAHAPDHASTITDLMCCSVATLVVSMYLHNCRP